MINYPPRPILETRSVSKQFGGLKAVDRCSLSVKAGTITGLIGPNGAGKTTLFNLISGIYYPDEGEIFFEGKRIDKLPPHKIFELGIARTFQISRQLDSMTTLENMLLLSNGQRGEAFWCPIFLPWKVRSQEKELVEKAMEILKWIGLKDLWNKPARELSAGQKKLLGLARAMISSPKLILLDEPGAGINPVLLNQLIETIQRMVKEKGITVFLIEHDMNLVMHTCNPIIVMAEGKKLMEGTPEEVCSDRRVLMAYLGGVK